MCDVNEVFVLSLLQAKYKLKVFQNLRVVLVGFPAEEQGQMEDLVRQNGGFITTLDDQQATHVVRFEAVQAYLGRMHEALRYIIEEYTISGLHIHFQNIVYKWWQVFNYFCWPWDEMSLVFSQPHVSFSQFPSYHHKMYCYCGSCVLSLASHSDSANEKFCMWQ